MLSQMIQGANHITLAVTNLERSFNFYKDILWLKPLCRWDKGAYFLAGDFWFCLTLDENRVALPNACSTHFSCTVLTDDFKDMCQRIRDSQTIIYKENKSEGESLYFLDPDGHKLEIHVGSWQSRINHKKQNPGTWQDVEFFV